MRELALTRQQRMLRKPTPLFFLLGSLFQSLMFIPSTFLLPQFFQGVSPEQKRFAFRLTAATGEGRDAHHSGHPTRPLLGNRSPGGNYRRASDARLDDPLF